MLIHQLWIPKYVIHIYYLFMFLYNSNAFSKLIFFKLRAAGLLPVARLVEGDRLRAEVPRAERLTRFNYDTPLIAAFMDWWRPETHTLHSPRRARWPLVWRTLRCWEDCRVLARRWGRSTSPRRGTLTSLLGSWTFLGTIARQRCTCPSPTPAGPPWTWIQQFSVRDSNSYFQHLYAF
jgi:hypothetical protein